MSQDSASSGGDPDHQLTVIALAGVLWSWWPAPTFAALLIAYAGALLLVNSSLVLAGPVLTLNRLPRRWAVITAVLVLAAPMAILLRESPRLVWYEQLTLLQENLPDRVALEQTPALFPNVLRTDLPQRFFVHAPDVQQVRADWEGLKDSLNCISLGHGLFCLDYQPAVHGAPVGRDDHIDIHLTLDQRTATQRARWIRPLPHPRWFTSNPGSGRAATVSEETDQLVIVHRDGSHQIIEVADGPSDCQWIDDNRLVVSHRYSGTLTWVDLAADSQVTVPDLRGRWTRLALSPGGEVLAAGRGGERPQVVVMPVSSLLPSATEPLPLAVIDLPDEPDWICFGRNAGLLIVSCRRTKSVYRIIHHSPELLDEAVAKDSHPRGGISQYEPWTLDPQPLKLPRPVAAMGRGHDGDIYLGATTDVVAANSGDAGQAEQGNHFIVHTIHYLDTYHWRIRRSLRTDRRSQRQDLPGNSDRGGSPLGFCATTDNGLLVSMAGTNEVWQMSSFDNIQPVDLRSPGMSAPHGVGDLGNGHWCVSSPADGAIEVFNGKQQLVARIDLVHNDLREEEIWRRWGERTFYETTRSGISCQSCHLHGDSDYSEHNIGQGHLSSTLSTAGIAGTAPYLRDASNSRLRDLHQLAMGHYRGYRREAPWDRARALSAYLASLPSIAPRLKADPQRLRRGVDAFVKADCVRCHTFPAFTNLGVHFTSFLFPEQSRHWRTEALRPHLLDTPSLRGLHHSAPYLHDGRGQTIWQVLHDHNPKNRHGNVQSLSREELEDLTLFLKSL